MVIATVSRGPKEQILRSEIKKERGSTRDPPENNVKEEKNFKVQKKGEGFTRRRNEGERAGGPSTSSNGGVKEEVADVDVGPHHHHFRCSQKHNVVFDFF